MSNAQILHIVTHGRCGPFRLLAQVEFGSHTKVIDKVMSTNSSDIIEISTSKHPAIDNGLAILSGPSPQVTHVAAAAHLNHPHLTSCPKHTTSSLIPSGIFKEFLNLVIVSLIG